jgi:hypothetical protein
VIGLVAHRAMPVPARRVLGGTVAAGAMILVLRYALPTALRDAKEIELLLVPIAVLSAAGLAVAWAQGRSGRAVAVLALAAGLGWAVLRDASLYAERFVAIGR